ncbi:Adaptor for signal transduction [Tulasnella sp. 419]|nr:Adaptor for signal transduction [Tulasnella sp. 419]
MSNETTVDQWDEETVHQWLSSIGYDHYYDQLIEHGISGDVLVYLDHETLKDLGVVSMGHRLGILKAIYHLKIAHHIELEPESYVPPSEAVNIADHEESYSLESIVATLHDQGNRIKALEQENQRLQENLMSLELVITQRTSSNAAGGYSSTSLQKQPSFKWAYGKPVKSPTRPVPEESSFIPHQDSPHLSPQALEHDISNQSNGSKSSRVNGSTVDHPDTSTTSIQTPSVPPPQYSDRSTSRGQTNSALSTSTSATLVEGSKPSRSGSGGGGGGAEDRSENQFHSFKVALDDPCSKVLPAALKKYKITDDWKQYAMFICYGTTERCLALDEKPLLLFKRLKDANKNPIFMLRHIKDIRSPIIVAQQKQSGRKPAPSAAASPSPNAGGSNTVASQQLMKKLDAKMGGASYTRDTRLHQTPAASLQPLSAKAQQLSASTSNSRANGASTPGPWLEGSTLDDSSRARTATEDSVATEGSGVGSTHGDAVVLANGVSYAIAIYPYEAEQEDEFDVAVGSMFIILSKAKGWWVVQVDVNGTGQVDESAKQGWVPAGCLLETSVPPATAVAEALGRSPRLNMSNSNPISDSPILPGSIISTCFPGIALMDYEPKGDHELNLAKDNMLKVFKRYNHWSYAVREEDGERGWVPSWLIGKVMGDKDANSSSGGTGAPPTPHTANLSRMAEADESRGLMPGVQSNLPAYSLPQPSPMSPGFPPSTNGR